MAPLNTTITSPTFNTPSDSSSIHTVFFGVLGVQLDLSSIYVAYLQHKQRGCVYLIKFAVVSSGAS